VIEGAGDRALWAALFGVLGLAVGSFLNVVIWRVPRGESVAHPASRCPGCGAAIRPWDNIPVVSWLVLRGKCRGCATSISARYPIVEAGTALLFALLALRFELDWALAGFLVLGASLLAVALIDLEHYIVPNRILVVVAPLGAAILAAVALADGKWDAFGRGVGGGVAAFAGLLVVHLISPRGMGMGDVKLAFVLGLFLGWLSWGHVALGMFLGFLLGAVVGGLLVVTGVRTRREAVPFAPFLAAGTMLAVFFGRGLLDWYSGL